MTRGVDQSTDRDALININKERTVRSHNTILSSSRVYTSVTSHLEPAIDSDT